MRDRLLAIKEFCELLSYLLLLFGLPISAWQYFRNAKIEQHHREQATYDALHDEYMQYLQLTFQNPQLDISDFPYEVPPELTPAQARQEKIAFSFLISIFERAYLMYRDETDAFRQRQWSGWDQYIREYCERDNFRAVAVECSTEFDADFIKYFTRILDETAKPDDAAVGQLR